MNKRTPNRWTVTHEMNGVGNRQVWGIVTADTGEPVANCGTDGEGSARFIVHACECYADLLSALEYIISWTPDTEKWNPETAREMARAAIAKATGADHE